MSYDHILDNGLCIFTCFSVTIPLCATLTWSDACLNLYQAVLYVLNPCCFVSQTHLGRWDLKYSTQKIFTSDLIAGSVQFQHRLRSNSSKFQKVYSMVMTSLFKSTSDCTTTHCISYYYLTTRHSTVFLQDVSRIFDLLNIRNSRRLSSFYLSHIPAPLTSSFIILLKLRLLIGKELFS